VEERYLKNKQIIHDYFQQQVEKGNKDLEEIFRKKGGAFPMDVIFKLIIGPEISVKMIKQIDLISDCAIETVKNPDRLEEIIEKNFKKYLRFDSTNANFRKRHEAYEKLAIPIFRRLFKVRIENNLPMVQAESGENYKEISHLAVPKKEDSLAALRRQQELNHELLDVIKNNRSIINVTGLIRADIIDAIFTMYEYIDESWEQAINELYD